MKYADQPVRKYLEDLGAKLPAPGGGSASALVAAAGTALLAMTANYTAGKKGYEQHGAEIDEMLRKLAVASGRLAELLDLDVEAYGEVSAAYGMPKTTGEERGLRDEKIHSALRSAMRVPREIFFICADMIRLSARLAETGNRNLVSDVGCGALFLRSAMLSAKFNVDINLASIGDEALAERTLSELSSVAEECCRIAGEAEAAAAARIGQK